MEEDPEDPDPPDPDWVLNSHLPTLFEIFNVLREKEVSMQAIREAFRRVDLYIERLAVVRKFSEVAYTVDVARQNDRTLLGILYVVTNVLPHLFQNLKPVTDYWVSPLLVTSLVLKSKAKLKAFKGILGASMGTHLAALILSAFRSSVATRALLQKTKTGVVDLNVVTRQGYLFSNLSIIIRYICWREDWPASRKNRETYANDIFNLFERVRNGRTDSAVLSYKGIVQHIQEEGTERKATASLLREGLLRMSA